MNRNIVPALALVDFDNYANFRGLGKPATQVHVEQALLCLLQNLYACCKEHPQKITDLEVRFYGGWYDVERNGKSDRMRMLEKAISRIPKRFNAMRLKLVPVESLISVVYTPLRLEARYERLQLRISEEILQRCLNPDLCLTKKVHEWQKHGCPYCEVKHEKVLRKKIQKAVDTAITVDMVYASTIGGKNLLILVSDDYDMLPGSLHIIVQKIPFRIMCTREESTLISEVPDSTIFFASSPFKKD